MSILVIGGAGYVGSHTCKALAAAGMNPVTLDNLSTGHVWAVRWGPLVVADFADRQALQETFARYEVDTVVHFAAQSLVGESVRSPRTYYANNLVKTLALLDTMLDAGVHRIVFSSTCAVYGVPQTELLDESHPQNPVNPYGETKLAIERVMRWYGEAYGLQWMALRYFNAAGADAEGEIGEVHQPETHLIPLAIDAAMHPDRPLPVYGTDYPTPDGTAIRDYIHVTDLADAHVRAIRRVAEGSARMSLNLGTGQGHSVREVVAAIEKGSGRRVAHVDAPRRQGDPPKLVAAAMRAESELGWRPAESSLDNIVQSAYRWKSRFAVQSLEPQLV